jgi:prepilin-type N-terminal cleavage/methylation domain-containing protein
VKNHSVEKGFSLIEVLTAMFLMAVMMLFLARLLLSGIQINYISKDEIRMNAMVTDRVEQLKNMSFKQLGMPCLESATSCGSLTEDVTDDSVSPAVKYYDDSIPNYQIRWVVTLPGGNLNTRRTTVQVISKQTTYIGEQRELTLFYDRTKF